MLRRVIQLLVYAAGCSIANASTGNESSTESTSSRRNAYVWIGDSETADMTDYESTYHNCAEPFFNFETFPGIFGSHLEMYLIHNQPDGYFYQADELCAEIKYVQGVIDINPSHDDLGIGDTGATCRDCFAYGGAYGLIGLHCYTEGTDTFCDLSAKVSGGYQHNADVLFSDPTIMSRSFTLPIWSGDKTELGRFDDGTGTLVIILEVTPSLYAGVSGTLQATGDLSAQCGAEGRKVKTRPQQFLARRGFEGVGVGAAPHHHPCKIPPFVIRAL